MMIINKIFNSNSSHHLTHFLLGTKFPSLYKSCICLCLVSCFICRTHVLFDFSQNRTVSLLLYFWLAVNVLFSSLALILSLSHLSTTIYFHFPSDFQAVRYIELLPAEKRPVFGTEGAVYRRQQMALQLPEHDQDPSKCHELTPAEVKLMQQFVRKYKDEALGVGDVILPEEMALVQAGGQGGAGGVGAGGAHGAGAGTGGVGAGGAHGAGAGAGGVGAGGAHGAGAGAGGVGAGFRPGVGVAGAGTGQGAAGRGVGPICGPGVGASFGVEAGDSRAGAGGAGFGAGGAGFGAGGAGYGAGGAGYGAGGAGYGAGGAGYGAGGAGYGAGGAGQLSGPGTGPSAGGAMGTAATAGAMGIPGAQQAGVPQKNFVRCFYSSVEYCLSVWPLSVTVTFLNIYITLSQQDKLIEILS